MPLSPAQISDVAHKMAKSREAKRRLALEPSPAAAREHQKIAQGLMQRRRAKSKGYL